MNIIRRNKQVLILKNGHIVGKSKKFDDKKKINSLIQKIKGYEKNKINKR